MKNTINISLKKNSISHSIAEVGGEKDHNLSVFNNFEKTHPWLNPDGSMRADEEISELGQTWSAETWDNYLKATINHGDSELLVEKSMDDLKAYIAMDFLNFLTTTENYEFLHAYVQEALSSQLSVREGLIIKMKYFENMSEREVAEQLDIKIPTLKRYRRDALRKLKSFFISKKSINEVKSLVLLRLLNEKAI